MRPVYASLDLLASMGWIGEHPNQPFLFQTTKFSLPVFSRGRVWGKVLRVRRFDKSGKIFFRVALKGGSFSSGFPVWQTLKKMEAGFEGAYHAKNHRLLSEIRTGGTEEMTAKPLTCGAMVLFEAGSTRNRFSNAF